MGCIIHYWNHYTLSLFHKYDNLQYHIIDTVTSFHQLFNLFFILLIWNHPHTKLIIECLRTLLKLILEIIHLIITHAIEVAHSIHFTTLKIFYSFGTYFPIAQLLHVLFLLAFVCAGALLYLHKSIRHCSRVSGLEEELWLILLILNRRCCIVGYALNVGFHIGVLHLLSLLQCIISWFLVLFLIFHSAFNSLRHQLTKVIKRIIIHHVR